VAYIGDPSRVTWLGGDPHRPRFGEPAGPSAAACAPEPGEVAASRTDAGILVKDVEFTDKGVLIADFGVDRGSVKPGARAELSATLAQLENDSVKEIKITGFDDCLRASDQAHRDLRRRRARKVLELLGPKARAKLKFADGAPLGTFIGPNTDRASRARNRSVLIEFVKGVSFEDEPLPVTAMSCHEQLIRRALRQMRDDQNLDGKIKSRLGAALGNSLAGRDDSFIRPGSTSWMFPFHWSSIQQYFKLLCAAPGGAAALSGAGLMRKLVELDQDIRNGVELLIREEQKFSSILNKKMLLATEFRRRLDALLSNKAQSVYAEY
jgi:outer membrane protein OmpA-like peptidoglycan-associated protein